MAWLELKLPPPIVTILTGLLMWVISLFVTPLPVPLLFRAVMAAALAVVGVACAVASFRRFLRAGTTIDPHHPEDASALVTTGIYARTRNPIYLGMLVVLLAWDLFLMAWPTIVGPIVFVLYITRFQIIPEERALTEKFGQAYTDYRAKVRRWL
jgi:protein-S-isoprenylcysteine O-methyltransferase Ste14